MKKRVCIWSGIFLAVFFSGLVFSKQLLSHQTNPATTTSQIPKPTEMGGLPNPASGNCQDQGGTLELVTNADGSQFGLCQFDHYACDEWVLYRGECTLDADAAKIRDALISMGRSLSASHVVIKTHLGKYLEANVVPNSGVTGGGYVFAVKTDGQITILSDGNGAIFCHSFAQYPDFPAFLVPECVDDSGNLIAR